MFKVHEEFPHHHKLDAVRLKSLGRYIHAVGVWLVLGCDSRARLTDGFVHDNRLKLLFGGDADALTAVEDLVKAKLLNRATHGVRFHDWEDHQETKKRIQERRFSNKKNQRSKRERDTASADDLDRVGMGRVKGRVKGGVGGKPDPAPWYVQEIFAHWQQVHGHPTAKLGPKRRKLIKDRIGEGYTPDQLKAAIDGCKVSKFHQGDNSENKIHDSFELILRDGKVETFIGYLRDAKPKGPDLYAGKRLVNLKRAD